jgi:hypothetical protein
MSIRIRALSQNVGRLRKRIVGNVELRTADSKIDLGEEWKYRKEMLALCEDFGVPIVWLSSDPYRSYAETSSITVRPPVCPDSLWVIAHEAAHVGFNHSKASLTHHRMEFEACQFESQYLKFLGIVPSQGQVESGKLYVARIICMDIQSGAKTFDRDAWEFAQSAIAGEDLKEFMNTISPRLVDQSRDNGFRETMHKYGKASTLPIHVQEPAY